VVTILETAFISIKFAPEEYEVRIETYGADGRLSGVSEYKGVKQIVFRDVEVRVNRQLSQTLFILIAVAPRLEVSFVENSVLYLRGRNE